MRVFACQLDIVWEDRTENHARTRELVAAASPPPGSLLVLPEMFATGFSMDTEVTGGSGAAETEAFLRELASRHRCAVIAGVVSCVEEGGRNLFFNEALALAPAGPSSANELARYRKMHLFTSAREHDHYSPGEAPVVFGLPGPGGFCVAPLICYDLRFPEVFREAVREGADLFTVIANWPAERVSHWETLLRARAIENQACVVGVNRAGAGPSHEYPGRSMMLGPGGEVLAEAGRDECVVSAEVDPGMVERARREFPALDDMR